MKKMILILSLIGLSTSLSRDNYVNGYYRTDRNDTKRDNYSTYGNVNPYTGSVGTVKTYDSYSSPSYNNYGNSGGVYNGNSGYYGR